MIIIITIGPDETKCNIIKHPENAMTENFGVKNIEVFKYFHWPIFFRINLGKESVQKNVFGIISDFGVL